MDYDQEATYFRGSCIEYDVSDMFQMLVDISLEPRSVLAANVARSKNRKSHDLSNHLQKFDPFAYNQELLLTTAYGYNTLGNPIRGLAANVDNIDARVMQKFVMDNVTPGKCVIVASGIQNHEEFVDLCKERLGELLPVPEHEYERSVAEYIGGEYRNWTESPTTSIQVAFEGSKWTGADQVVFQVMSELLGDSNTPHSRAHSNVASRNNFVDAARAINHHFTDTGLFGFQIQGAGTNSADLCSVLLEELNGLKDTISDEELNRAKNNLKMSLINGMQKRGDRIEEIGRNYLAFGGKLTFASLFTDIDAVTAEDVNRVTKEALGGKPTIVVTGGAINLVPNITDVSRQLK